jgi:saccharopine dehydrogenase-like NADP-dependent oxidoreductase
MNGLPLQPTDALLVVGGYGRVGRVVSARLGRRFPGRVVAAGRRLERAEALAAEEEGRVVPRRLDLADGDALPPALDGVRLVVLGIEGPNERVARACFERGVHLVDVTATYRLMEAVERHDALARSRGATGVLSVGLAPGLTNLLAQRAAQALDAVERVDLTVLLGLGERHGADALRWVLDTASRPFTLQTPEGPIVARSFGAPRTTALPGFGRRRAYRFDFADQHVLRRTLGAGRVETRLCFDAAFVTGLFALLARAGTLRWADRLDARRLAALLTWIPGGGEAFVVKAEAQGQEGGRPHTAAWTARGNGEAEAAGHVAAYVAERLYEGALPSGVFHAEQVLDPEAVFEHLRRRGLRIGPEGEGEARALTSASGTPSGPRRRPVVLPTNGVAP